MVGPLAIAQSSHRQCMALYLFLLRKKCQAIIVWVGARKLLGLVLPGLMIWLIKPWHFRMPQFWFGWCHRVRDTMWLARTRFVLGFDARVPDPFVRLGGGMAAFEQHYKIVNRITDSTFGRVLACSRRADPSKMHVVKIVRMKDHPLLNSPSEREVTGARRGCAETKEFWRYMTKLLMMRHDNIVRYLTFFADFSSFYFVMERCPGQTLLGHLLSETKWHEAAAQSLMKQLLEALRYIHGLGILHRDIKLENLMVLGGRSFANTPRRTWARTTRTLQLLDFGLGCEVASASGTIGTLGYMAPEVFIAQKYSFGADIFSTGVVMHILLTGRPCFKPPISTRFYEEHLHALCQGPNFSLHPLPMVTQKGRGLLQSLLFPHQEDRCSAPEALKHAWLKRPVAEGSVLWFSSSSELRFLKVMGVWSGSSCTAHISNALNKNTLQSIDEGEDLCARLVRQTTPRSEGSEERIIEELCARLVRQMNVPVCIGDPSKPDCPLISISNGFEELTGYAECDIIGKNCRFLNQPRAHEIPEGTRQEVRDAASGACTFLGVLPNVRADGSSFEVLLNLSPICVLGRTLIVGVQMEFEPGTVTFEDHKLLGCTRNVLSAIRHWLCAWSANGSHQLSDTSAAPYLSLG